MSPHQCHRRVHTNTKKKKRKEKLCKYTNALKPVFAFSLCTRHDTDALTSPVFAMFMLCKCFLVSVSQVHTLNMDVLTSVFAMFIPPTPNLCVCHMRARICTITTCSHLCLCHVHASHAKSRVCCEVFEQLDFQHVACEGAAVQELFQHLCVFVYVCVNMCSVGRQRVFV